MGRRVLAVTEPEKDVLELWATIELTTSLVAENVIIAAPVKTGNGVHFVRLVRSTTSATVQEAKNATQQTNAAPGLSATQLLPICLAARRVTLV